MTLRAYFGRHRTAADGRRAPRSLHSGFLIPTAAAATLVLTATGVSVAQSSPIGLRLSAGQTKTVAAQASEDAIDRAQLERERQQVSLASAALQGRAEQAQRAARNAQRVALAKAAAEKDAERWVLPVKHYVLTSGFGMRWGKLHAGEDFACPVGTPLVSMSKGVVTFAGQESGYGNLVKITYWDGTESFYGHMSRLTAKKGQAVMPGGLVGYSGDTGHSTGPHMHLEIHPKSGAPINPLPWLAAHGIKP